MPAGQGHARGGNRRSGVKAVARLCHTHRHNPPFSVCLVCVRDPTHGERGIEVRGQVHTDPCGLTGGLQGCVCVCRFDSYKIVVKEVCVS